MGTVKIGECHRCICTFSLERELPVRFALFFAQIDEITRLSKLQQLFDRLEIFIFQDKRIE